MKGRDDLVSHLYRLRRDSLRSNRGVVLFYADPAYATITIYDVYVYVPAAK